MPKNSGDKKTYTVKTTVPKFNLMSLDLASIESELEYLLFVEHEEDMKGYTHLRKIIPEVAKLVVHINDRAVAEFQHDMTYRIAESLQDHVVKLVLGTQKETRDDAFVNTTVDDEKVVGQTTEVVERHNDW